ncbi:hypothetical protein G9A89_007924 [Geosiphon pyriformis]|nr:hypothetical protein G9A89_007924 [Geosiphon pyriformis]
MRVCYYCELLTYDAAATLSTTSISNANLSTNNTSNLSATATAFGNISALTNSNTTTELILKQNPKAEIDPTKLEIVDDSLPTDPHLLVTLEDTQPNNLETNQHPTLTSNILPATITKNKSLDAIFLFELKKPLTTPLFSGATLEKKTHYCHNALDNQNDKKSGTINYVSYVELFCLMKECGMTFLDKEGCAMRHAKEDEPISNCTLELESTFNSNSNSDNDDKENTSFSSTQYDNENINNSDFDSNPKIYIALPNLSKEQKLK